jgi:hypothetical protein
MAVPLVVWAAVLAAGGPGVELRQRDELGQLQVLIGGQEALVYQYGKRHDMAHWYPLRSPSGKLLTVEQDEPYPHHRSFWVGDQVQLRGGPKVSFFVPLYSRIDKNDPQSPFRDQILHVKFLRKEVTPAGAEVAAQLVWVTDQGQTPVVDEVRRLRIVPLGAGEYCLDCRFTVTAAYGDVAFASDQTHYAWPYVRMHPQFAVEPIRMEKDRQGQARPVARKGTGTITTSEGAINGKAAFMKPARWVDYSGRVEGASEGLALFADPDFPPPRFFTRDYGTFGPRRPDSQSGRPFTLARGQSLRQRVGVLVHRGDVNSGRVVARYQAYQDGKL